MKYLLSLLLFCCGLAWSRDGPKEQGEYVLMTKAEAERINTLLGDAAALIKKQAKEIERLKGSTGCI